MGGSKADLENRTVPKQSHSVLPSRMQAWPTQEPLCTASGREGELEAKRLSMLLPDFHRAEL